MKDKLINGTLFNLSWLLIVFTHSNIWGPVILATHLAIHFAYSGFTVRELKLVAAVMSIGLVVDQGLFLADIFTINGIHSIAPPWFTCLWGILATTLCHAFSGLQKQLCLGAVLGAMGAWFSYQAGVSLTPVTFTEPLFGPLIVALLWFALFPIILYMARWVEPDQLATIR